MPIITDPKKLSMPEQVQKNKDDISEIRKVIDGLDVEDNVVVVDDIAHIMTAEELEAIKQPVAFIVYNGHLYFKRTETATIAYFDVVFSITNGAVITFASSEIEASLSNGGLNIVNNTVSTYSATQIDNKLSLKANITYVDNNFAALTGANFTGAITAPSIVETMSGYSFTKDSDLATNGVSLNYVGVVKNGNKLTFIISGVFTRNSNTTNNVFVGHLLIPATVGEKLYLNSLGALDNKSVNFFNSTTSHTSLPMRTGKGSNTSLGITIYATGGLTLDTPYEFRYETTFLLSENLA